MEFAKVLLKKTTSKFLEFLREFLEEFPYEFLRESLKVFLEISPKKDTREIYRNPGAITEKNLLLG